MDVDLSEDPFVRVGDNICLHCTDTDGYIFCENTCSLQNSLFVFHEQDKERPEHISNPHVATFLVTKENRYKLNKKLRQKIEDPQATPESIAKAQELAAAETNDNKAEWKRLKGKPLKYGDVIQLKHIFTNKYIHVDTKQTSRYEKSKLKTCLLAHDGKEAQFKILPRYKVNSEGEKIRVKDQIILENVKATGQYLHASVPVDQKEDKKLSELNLGAESSEFTLVKRFKCSEADFAKTSSLWGGVVVQIQHKHLEGYLDMETGGENKDLSVHLRIKEANSKVAASFYRPTSCTTYWQLEGEYSIMSGDPLHWGEHIRIRHLVTRKYLYINGDTGDVGLQTDGFDPKTVFKIQSLYGERGYIEDENFVRFEHVLSGRWLHGEKDLEYERKSYNCSVNQDPLRQITASPKMEYSDAFSVLCIPYDRVLDCYYVVGMLPLITKVSKQLMQECIPDDDLLMSMVVALSELEDFINEKGSSQKTRRRNLRELRILDMLKDILENEKESGDTLKSAQLPASLCDAIYHLIHAAVSNNDVENSLHMAQYLDFFQAHISKKEFDWQNMVKIMTEIVRNKKAVIARIKPNQIERCIFLLKKYGHPGYIPLLRALCVCDGIAISKNQTLIGEKLLEKQYNFYRLTLREGQVYIGKQDQVTTLAQFLNNDARSSRKAREREFLYEQFQLFLEISKSRNQRCIDLIVSGDEPYISLDVILNVIDSPDIADDWKAHCLQLTTALFVDVGYNTTLTECVASTFDCNTIVREESFADWMLKQSNYVDTFLNQRTQQLREWILIFLGRNPGIIASMDKRNLLVKTSLSVMFHLLKFGYMDELSIVSLKDRMQNLLSGARDLPTDECTIEDARVYLSYERYLNTALNEMPVAIKQECLHIHSLLVDLHTEFILERFIALFVSIEEDVSYEERSQGFKKFAPFLLSVEDTPTAKWRRLFVSSPSASLRKVLDELFLKWPIVEHEWLETRRLLDLAKYDFADLSTCALQLVHKFKNLKSIILSKAATALLIKSETGQVLHREVQIFMPLLQRLVSIKDIKVVAIFDRFTSILQGENEAHTLGQNMLLNYGLLPNLIQILQAQDLYLVDKDICIYSAGHKAMLSKALILLQEMVTNNEDIQAIVFTQLDVLLNLNCGHSELADLLIQVFHNNALICRQIKKSHIRCIIQLTYGNQVNPKMLKVLQNTVSLHGGNTLIHRNQSIILQQLLECYPKHGGIFDVSETERQAILSGEKGSVALEYFMNIVGLVVLCNKDTSGVSQGFSQNIFRMQEVLYIINNKTSHPSVKRTFLKFLLYIFIEPGVAKHTNYLARDWSVWNGFLSHLEEELDACNKYLTELQPAALRQNEDGYWCAEACGVTDGGVILEYVVDAVLPFLQGYLKLQRTDKYQSRHRVILFSLSEKLKDLLPMLCPLVDNPVQQANIKATWVLVAVQAGRKTEDINNKANLLETSLLGNPGGLTHKTSTFYVAQKSQEEQAEKTLNQKLQNFVRHCERIYTRPDTLTANIQLQLRSEMGNQKYTVLQNCAALPLHEDFQRHVRTFLATAGARQYKRYDYHTLLLLINHLKMSRETHFQDEDFEIRCLQILRSAMHNIIATLPKDHPQERKQALRMLHEVQQFYANEDLVATVLGLMSGGSQRVFCEVVALLNTLLYDANTVLQDKTITYFMHTQEEIFFSLIKDHIQDATEIALERKFLLQQVRRLKDETEQLQSSPVDTTQLNGGVEKEKLVRLRKTSRWKLTSQKSKIGIIQKRAAPADTDMPQVYKSVKGVHAAKSVESKQQQLASIKDDGIVQLILKVISKLCDGQHKPLQNYMREQPDNLQSYNVMVAIIQYLGVVYASLSEQSIHIMTEVFETLTELCSGNQENRMVILDSKVIDYINFLLRSHDDIEECSVKDRFHLYQVIATLLIALMEENGPEPLKVAMSIAIALDYSSLIAVIQYCYQFRQQNILVRVSSKLHSRVVADKDKDSYEILMEMSKKVGTKLYIILTRCHTVSGQDLHAYNPAENKDAGSAENWPAIEYFMDRTLSIEVVKDGHLQTIYFPNSQALVIRRELKEKMKWNVDRSSPSNKINDFIQWSDILIRDVFFHQKMLSNIFSRFLTGWRRFFSFFVIFLSIALNVMMLSVWKAKFDVTQIPQNATQMPQEIYDPEPVTSAMPFYVTVKLSLSIMHNVLSVLVFISFWLSHNPSLPSTAKIKQFFAKVFRSLLGRASFKTKPTKRKKKIESSEQHQEEDDPYSTHLISFLTFYYLCFVALSILGTLMHGYFFAFHLFHIVLMVDLLQGVIRAVTMNGKSLIWVTILGMIVLYVYALFGFAKMRSLFRPSDQLFCSTLVQCTMTIIRYGMVGDIGEVLRNHDLDNTFERFFYLSIYQITFFIFFTTIGLNIIFGIIVDTFSELRDMKWRSAKDMQEYCFICSIPAYRFEHKPGGFYDHVHNDHCMWSYIYYFIYLTNTNHNDYTSLDSYVSELRDRRSHDYFPFERALVLQQEENKDEAIIENMAQQIEFLVKKSKEHDQKILERSQDKQQHKWKKKATLQQKREHLSSESHSVDEPKSLTALSPKPTSGSKSD